MMTIFMILHSYKPRFQHTLWGCDYRNVNNYFGVDYIVVEEHDTDQDQEVSERETMGIEPHNEPLAIFKAAALQMAPA